MYTDYNNLYSSYLSHSGKRGMKWGIRNKKKKKKKQLNKFENKKVNISDDKKQKRLQARYGHSLDESNMKYHPLKGTISYGTKGK